MFRDPEAYSQSPSLNMQSITNSFLPVFTSVADNSDWENTLRSPIYSTPNGDSGTGSKILQNNMKSINNSILFTATGEEDYPDKLYDYEDVSAATDNFTEEEANDLLASDKEEMEVDVTDEEDLSTSPSDSFRSAKSSCDSISTPQSSSTGICRASSAVRAARLALMTSRSLSTGAAGPQKPISTLLDVNDGRNHKSFKVHSFKTKRIISASFNTATMLCVTCEDKHRHQVLRSERASSTSTLHYPSVFVLTDQSFPACLPTGGEGECLKILRMEDASLADLTNIFLETVKGYEVSAGTIILIHSLSHLAWVGAAAYAEDLVRARQRICAVYRTGLFVLHGPPILANGYEDTTTTRDLCTISDWATCVKPLVERDISTTWRVWRNLIVR